MIEDNKNNDIYYTINELATATLKIKGSVFIAGAFPVQDSGNALEILKKIRTENYDANHNCFAYKIGFDGREFRASDDGEPSGTAGKPIMFMISKFGLSDILVVVTRYFGGTKLGVGGLVRAYSDSAEAVLQIVNRKTVHRTRTFNIQCSYQDVQTVKKLIEKEAVTFSEHYTDVVSFEVKIHLSESENFKNTMFNLTNGHVSALELFE